MIRALALLGLALAAPAHAASCIAVADLVSPVAFRHYPAPPAKAPWHAVDVRSGTARMFRTILRAQDPGPDFAGRYRIARIGCGAGAECPAFIDRVTGRVSFVAGLRTVSWMLSDDTIDTDQERLVYRRDSRLLAVVGMRDEDEKTGGVTLYDWHAGSPKLIRFVPQDHLCRKDAS